MPESEINNLLSKMNTEEKIGQLNQYFSRGNFNPEMIRQGKAGSVINAAGALTGAGESKSATAETCNEIQKLALEAPHKIPQLFGRDPNKDILITLSILQQTSAAWHVRKAHSVTLARMKRHKLENNESNAAFLERMNFLSRKD